METERRSFKSLIKKIFYNIGIILSYANKVIYKQNNNIVLYSNLGFRDNVEAVYRYLILKKYNQNYKIICVTDEWKKFNKRALPKNVKFVNCYFGVFYFLISKYFFYCFGKYPIKPSKNQCVVNLWHGMPLKKVGVLIDTEKKSKQNYFTYILATSEFFGRHMEEAFNCESEQVVICGQPRNDDLFDGSVDIKNMFRLHQNCKMVCYMPTFRKSEILEMDNSTVGNCLYERLKQNDILEKLNIELKKLNVFMFIKPHPMDDFNKTFIETLDNIMFIDEEWLESSNLNVYKFLSKMDALITDYSSVYFDFLLLDKPLGFIIDDLYGYEKSRGFIVNDPEKLMPGFKIKGIEELVKFLKNVSRNFDEYQEERKKINDLCNYYQDGNNCQRLLEKIGIVKEGVNK